MKDFKVRLPDEFIDVVEERSMILIYLMVQAYTNMGKKVSRIANTRFDNMGINRKKVLGIVDRMSQYGIDRDGDDYSFDKGVFGCWKQGSTQRGFKYVPSTFLFSTAHTKIKYLYFSMIRHTDIHRGIIQGDLHEVDMYKKFHYVSRNTWHRWLKNIYDLGYLEIYDHDAQDFEEDYIYNSVFHHKKIEIDYSDGSLLYFNRLPKDVALNSIGKLYPGETNKLKKYVDSFKTGKYKKDSSRMKSIFESSRQYEDEDYRVELSYQRNKKRLEEQKEIKYEKIDSVNKL